MYDTDTIHIEVPDLTPIIDTNTIPGCDGLYVEYENLTPFPKNIFGFLMIVQPVMT